LKETDTDTCHETERHVEVDASFADFCWAELIGQVRRAALMVGSLELAQDLVSCGCCATRWRDRAG